MANRTNSTKRKTAASRASARREEFLFQLFEYRRRLGFRPSQRVGLTTFRAY